jgi:predicted PurR-regulated permease PerM
VTRFGPGEPSESRAAVDDLRDANDSQVLALRVIAGLMLAGAAWLLAWLVVPFVLALVLAVAASPLADRLERRGLPRSLAALACTLLLLLALSAAVGLIVYEAATVFQDSDRYLSQFSRALHGASRRPPLDRVFEALGLSGRDSTPAGWEAALRRSAAALGRWLVSGVGGLLGVLGGGVVALAAFFYMVEGRRAWVAGLTAASRRLGMRPTHGLLETVRHQVVTYLGCLAMVACGYAVVVSLALWLIGVPQPILWGLLAGMLEVVPYFGPLVSSILPTLVALSLGTLWKPLAVGGLFLTLHLVEGYVITPKLYGRAVKLDPVTVLFGALFFGALWGPVGLAIATPMMLILRGFLASAPDTPALDALAGSTGDGAAEPEVAGRGA